ncbi:MAG: hypothetical protein WCB85_08750 [Candidatus Dormiibacterota bacterium]
MAADTEDFVEPAHVPPGRTPDRHIGPETESLRPAPKNTHPMAEVPGTGVETGGEAAAPVRFKGSNRAKADVRGGKPIEDTEPGLDPPRRDDAVIVGEQQELASGRGGAIIAGGAGAAPWRGKVTQSCRSGDLLACQGVIALIDADDLRFRRKGGHQA